MPEQRALIPGTLLGYREWYMDATGNLWPLSVRSSGPWERDWNKASCERHSQFRGNHLANEVPGRDCGCGFYGTYSYQSQFKGFYNAPSVRLYAVAGVIEAKGRVTLHERGFRAEQARVMALFPLKGLYAAENLEHMREIAGDYRVPLLSNWREAEERFPSVDPESLGIQPLKPLLDVGHIHLSNDKVSSIYFNTG